MTRLFRTAFLFFGLSTLFLSCTKAAETPKSYEELIIGTWHLDKAEVYINDELDRDVTYAEIYGELVFTPDGKCYDKRDASYVWDYTLVDKVLTINYPAKDGGKPTSNECEIRTLTSTQLIMLAKEEQFIPSDEHLSVLMTFTRVE